jgi:anti-sigma regulatory factor (Ser/Thr protein kinase)
MRSLRVPARGEFLESLQSYVLQEASAAGASDGILFRIELAIEETLTNIMKYAYAGKAGEVEVDCSTGPSSTFTVMIRDWGIPFNPLNCVEPDTSQDFQDRPVGGLGIFLIRKIADRVVHCPLDDGNLLTLSFFLR